jgi:hypothetical protein
MMEGAIRNFVRIRPRLDACSQLPYLCSTIDTLACSLLSDWHRAASIFTIVTVSYIQLRQNISIKYYTQRQGDLEGDTSSRDVRC